MINIYYKNSGIHEPILFLVKRKLEFPFSRNLLGNQPVEYMKKTIFI